jgi:hypothetical protein
VVFVPEEAVDAVRDAVCAAGAGHIGNYSHCTFRTPGEGTFLPLQGAHPYVGQVGELERAREFRLETIVPASVRDRVVAAMLEAHPYEEVAYDLYRLHLPGPERGIGRDVAFGHNTGRVRGASEAGLWSRRGPVCG